MHDEARRKYSMQSDCGTRLGWALLAAVFSGGCGGPLPPAESPSAERGPLFATAESLVPLGATLTAAGASFRVWAPHASQVFVAGEWNGFSPTKDPLTASGSGEFSGEVVGARKDQQYMFVLQHGTQTLWRADPRGRRMVSSVGNSILVDPDAYKWTVPSFRPADTNQWIVYELHLGTFNPPRGIVPGTWPSATAKLDHLAALGVTAIEVMPPFEFPGDRSWGYNPAAPFALESAYGTPDDFRAFVDAAHARGIAVVLDVVHNHYSSRDNTLHCFDGECFKADGIYFYTDARRNTDWGPRPDFGRSQVRDYIRDNTLMWLGEYRVDGLRWDSVSNIRQASGAFNPEAWGMMRAINDAVHALPGKLQIAEDLYTRDDITRTTAAGGLGFDTQWDAAFFHPVDDTILARNDSDRQMGAIRAALEHKYNGHGRERVIYTESHDEVANGKQRIPEMIAPGDAGSYAARKRSTLGAAVLMTAPGIPMLFMGQEFLESGYFADTRPLDWSKTSRYAGILRLYTDLIRLRRNRDGKTGGLLSDKVYVYHVNDSAKVIAYRRWQDGGAGDDVIVVVNFSNRAFPVYNIGLPAGGTWQVRFNSDSKLYSADYDDTASPPVVATKTAKDSFAYQGAVALGRYSAVILSQ